MTEKDEYQEGDEGWIALSDEEQEKRKRHLTARHYSKGNWWEL